MKYDEKYRMTGIKEDCTWPSLLYLADLTGPCWHCGEQTNWVDIDFQAHICSTECHEAKIAEYITAECRAMLWAALNDVYARSNYPSIEMFSLWLREWVTAQLEEDEEEVEIDGNDPAG